MTRIDHDQRFKLLVKEFIADFFELFLPDYAPLFDFARVEWLESEAFPDPPQGRRRVLDIVGRLPLVEPVQTGAETWTTELVAVIHVEIESADSVQPLRTTMFQNFTCLRQKYAEPILPVALYLSVGLDGLGTDHYEERFGPLQVVRYNYLYIGLPALDAQAYLDRENWLGVALTALMKVPAESRARFKAEALNRLAKSPVNEYHKHLLADCVKVYLSLQRPGEQDEFERLLEKDEYREVRAMELTWYEEGLEQGRREARDELRGMATSVLERRFGALPEDKQHVVDRWPEDRLVELIDHAYRIDSLEGLRLDGNGQP